MRSKYRIELTSRDLNILQFIFEHRAVGHLQIANRFFKNTHRSVAHERLNKISKLGFLRKSSIMYGGVQTLFYSITEKGVQAFAHQFKYEITSPDYKSDSVNHDIGLVDIRKRLESTSMVVEYLSESVLQSCADLIESEEFRAFSILNSDAALRIDTKDGTYLVALEYEVSDKIEARYYKKLKEYYDYSSVDAVFYVCGNTKIEKMIHKADTKIGDKLETKVFTCLLDSFQKETNSFQFFNRKKSLLLLE